MKLSISQIETLIPTVSAVAVDGEKFTTISFEVTNVLADFPRDVQFLEIRYVDGDEFVYELSFTLDELLSGEILEGDLILADGRRLKFFTEQSIALDKL